MSRKNLKAPQKIHENDCVSSLDHNILKYVYFSWNEELCLRAFRLIPASDAFKIN